MLSRKVTPELVRAWKDTFEKYRSLLYPNKKTGPEIIEYLTGKYPVKELPAASISEVVADNVLLNECNARKLPAGQTPEALGFVIDSKGAGKDLYDHQEKIFQGIPIIVGVELHSAFFLVEGSSRLWDELFAFRGLDEDDLKNYYLVAEYVACLERFGLLESVLAGKTP